MMTEETRQQDLNLPLVDDSNNTNSSTIFPSYTQIATVSAQIATLSVKPVVASVFTLPFILSSIEMTKKYPIANSMAPGILLSVLSNFCIATIGWKFYAKHFLETFQPEHTIEHIAGHLKTEGKTTAAIVPWTLKTKLLVSFAAVVATVPLGLTKIGLEESNSSLGLTLKFGYLILYSMIDACPHVNHLQLQTQAKDKFLSLPWYFQAWVVTLMIGHALNDSADVYNAPNAGFLAWVIFALTFEAILSNVEAVAHHRPHLAELTLTSAAKFSILLYGAFSIAVFNWYSTFQNLPFSIQGTSQIVFLILQTINLLFLTFEAWNHEDESHHHSHNHGQACLDQANSTENKKQDIEQVGGANNTVVLCGDANFYRQNYNSRSCGDTNCTAHPVRNSSIESLIL